MNYNRKALYLVFLLKSLPEKYPNWWCKVEDGYIVNLEGDKLNKVPYDYNS